MTDWETAEQVVYISCVDEEVRYSFVSHLAEALRRVGLNEVFIDCENHLSEDAKAVVERARVSVMVLPGNCDPTKEYTDKLTQVLNCNKEDDQVVVSVLYSVGTLEGEWRRVLQNMSGLSQGHESRNEDSELVKEIVRDVYEKHFSVERVGVYSKLLEIEKMVNKQPLGTRYVGIWGMPGIGKTTLAQAVFDQMYGEFDAYCFIEDYNKVYHEKGLNRLMNEQFWEKIPVPGGIPTKLGLRKHKLKKKRVLVVLDDVRDPMLAKNFLRMSDWFAPESLFIITSRDKQVFRHCSVSQIYEVHGLDETEALQLFLLCASMKGMTEQNLPMEVIKYANGNPLALNIYASELKGKKELSGMEALKQHPPSEILDAFISSYDTLSDSEKNIFLDIACFFQGENVDYVMQLLDGCGFFPHVGIDVLVDKCLVTISENRVQMHNLTRDVGRKLIISDAVLNERRSRLWDPLCIKYILEDNEDAEHEGTEEIEGMFLDTSGLSFDVKPAAFKNMLNLRLLKIYCSSPETHPLINIPEGLLDSLPADLRLLHWENCPLQFLPQTFDPMHLVEINMPYSQLQKLWHGAKNLEMLKTIRLSHSQQLVDIDDLLEAHNLEVIDLQGCTRLQSFPATGQLLHLRVVNLSGCAEIKSFPEVPPNVEILQLQGTGITELPLSIVKSNDRELVNLLTDIPVLSGVSNLEQTDLESLTSLLNKGSSIQNPGKLICLDLKDCSRLQCLPNIVSLELLNVLDLSGCSDLKNIQGFPRNLKELHLAGTAVGEVPQLPQSLEVLNAHGCASLKSINLDPEKFPMHYTFSNCFSLSPQVVNLFLEKALANIKHVPRDHQQELNKASTFSFCAPSHDDHNSALDLLPGSSVMAQLNPSWRNTLVGFAMLVEFALPEDFCDATGFGISCVCRWKDKEGSSHRIERSMHFWAPGKGVPKKDHVFVFCDVKMRPNTDEGSDPDIWADLVVFEFFPVGKQKKRLDDSCTVKRCGVSAIPAAAGNTSHKMSSSGSFFDPVEFSGYKFKEVLRVRYDGLEEIDKALFLYIAGLFNDEDLDMVAPLIARIDLDVSFGLKVLANMSLIHVSSSGEILMHYLLRQMGKEILHGQSMLPRSLKEDSIGDFEKASFAFSSSCNWKYDVFPSFRWEDICKNFLNHFISSLERRLITTFYSTEIERGNAIRESNISIVVFSKNYASSCNLLNELVEIAESKKELNQIVIPLFYEVYPLDVKEQTGEFGRQFKETCKNKAEDEKQRWCQALTDIANIRGGYTYISENWDNEADLLEAISYDVSNKLNHKGSGDFDDIGIEGHISKVSSLLCLDSKKVRVVGIWGCTGIGKTTIARALYGRFGHQFQRSIFVNRSLSNKTLENSWRANLDGYGTKLLLQEQFLSEILGHKHCKVHHLGMIRDRLKDQKVLIILDDVDDIVQLEALAGNNRWFGSGSRIIVISKDEQLLKSHGIGIIYGVDLPSKEQALQMFCRAAFEQNSPPNGFMELAREAVKYSGNLPLDLVTFGSYMRGREEDYWTEILERLRYSLAGKIGERLIVRRESLSAHGNTLPRPSPLPVASDNSQQWKYHVYPSFYGNDVGRKFLSHFLVAFKHKSIITFKDNEMERGMRIQEIRDSMISIVVFSINYASSSLLLNELVEIAKCRQELSQKVIPVFYDIDPSDVQNQSGEFGRCFKQTCESETEDEKQWHQALIDIANISGYYSRRWENEAEMVEKIVNDISNTLGCTPSIGVHVLVGMKSHIAKMDSLLCLESEEVKMVGIWGPSGIGKSTIARALYLQISSEFEQSAFIDISNGYKKRANMDDYGAMLYFQTLFLSEVLNLKDLRADHIGAIKEMLKDQKVLIILDGVDDLFLLDALARETEWYGSGSRIIVITKDLRLLKSRGINCIYKVGLPSKRQALQMLCQSAFRQNSPLYGFMELAIEVVESAGNLPLGLKIFGSHLRGLDKGQWIQMLPRLRHSLDGEIEKVLRVGYDGLCDEDKDLFLHIACLFNHGAVEYVTRLLTGYYMDVNCGLTVLAEKSLIHISEVGNTSMHLLLQSLGREIVRRESIPEPGERRFLVDSRDICEVFNEESGTKRVLGISLDISELDRELSISKRGFSGMRNLRFLKLYTNLGNKEAKKEVNVHLPHGLDYLCPKLRLLHWETFPMRCMPSNFSPENLVELVMEASKLEKLWSKAQPLGSLKFMSLRDSLDLREIPDLTYATKLEKLDLAGCSLLKVLPSSIRNLHKLRDLDVEGCIKLEVLPTDINLVSLYCLNLKGCSQLRSFPDISRNVSDLYLDGTAIEEVPCWIEKISGLSYLSMNGCSKLKTISPNISKLKLLVEVNFSECEALTEDSWQNYPEISTSLMRVNMSGNSFRRLPDTWSSIQPKDLIFDNCRNLVSLPKLPASLFMLTATNCESLESLCGSSFDYPHAALQFINCFKLDQKARELILQSNCAYAILPGGDFPAYFTDRADGNLLTISLPQSPRSKRFVSVKACIMVEPRFSWFYFGVNWFFRGGNGKKQISCLSNTASTGNHLITFGCEFFLDEVSDVRLEFFCVDHKKETIKIKECGIRLLKVSPSADDSGRTEDEARNSSIMLIT